MIITLKECAKALFIGICCLMIYAIYSKVPIQNSYTIEHSWGSHTYTVDLTSEIQEDHAGYTRLATLIKSLNENDTVILNLHNYGGSVATAQILVNALVATKAHTIASVTGGTYSAGAVIACAAKELQLDKYSYLMFHNPRTNSGLVNGELRVQINKMMNECIIHNILTQSQLDDLNSTSLDLEIYYPHLPTPLPKGI